MSPTPVQVFGILNVTRDSFSDGGRYFDPGAAIAHAEALVESGADVVDVGAESTNPDAEAVDAAEELRRLDAVVPPLLQRGFRISVDTWKPEVMRAMAALGVQWLNDVRGFRTDGALTAAAAAPPHVRFVVMFSRSRGARAERGRGGVSGLLDEIHAFAAERKAAFATAGVAVDRVVLDPGMGVFVGDGPEPSVLVLRHLPDLARHGLPLLVSVSRKGFLSAITGRPLAERGSATLAAELWAVRRGAQLVRTHDPAALRAGLAIERVLGDRGAPGRGFPD